MYKPDYEVFGVGKSLLLIHGSFHHDCWMGFEKELAKSFKVYKVYLPGFGSKLCEESATHNTDLFAQVVAQLLGDKGLNLEFVLAHSLGCVVAAKAALLSGFKGRMVFGGALGKVIGWRAFAADYLPKSIKRKLVSTQLGRRYLVSPGLSQNVGMSRNNSNFAKHISATHSCAIADIRYKKEIEKDFYSALSSLKNEILYIYGEHDAQKGKNPLIQNYKTIKDAKHNVFHFPEATQTLKLIQDFLI